MVTVITVLCTDCEARYETAAAEAAVRRIRRCMHCAGSLVLLRDLAAGSADPSARLQDGDLPVGRQARVAHAVERPDRLVAPLGLELAHREALAAQVALEDAARGRSA
jgi:hypothetical protein